MTVVAIIGILSAVAIPSYLSYLEKTKTAEFAGSLKTIGDGARIYFSLVWTKDGDLNPLPHQFPQDAASTPTVSCCDQGGKCAAATSTWNTSTWNALRFQIDRPFYGNYLFSSSNDLVDHTNSVAAATVVADTNCDGNSITSGITVSVLGEDVVTSSLWTTGTD